MAKPDVQQQMEKQAFLLSPSTPEKLGEVVQEQMDSYRTILRAAGVQPE
jgi:tripartite-type tricarboxylate transporter receptor subunit TctC